MYTFLKYEKGEKEIQKGVSMICICKTLSPFPHWYTLFYYFKLLLLLQL